MALFPQRRGPVPFIDEMGLTRQPLPGEPVPGMPRPRLPAGMPAPETFPSTNPASGGGLFPKKRGVGGAIADFLMYYAAAQGSPIGAAGVQMRHKQLEAEREYAREQRQLAPVHAAIDADPNMTPQEKALAKGNPKAYLESWAQQFGTRVVNKGDTVHRGLGGGRADTYMAPQVHEVGNELIMTDPQNVLGRADKPAPAAGAATPSLMDPPSGLPPISTPIYRGRSDMETYASQFGEPGSKEWKDAIQDFRLRGAGPTAYVYKDQLQDQRLEQSNTNNVRTTGTSAANNIRTTTTSRDNNVRTTGTSRDNNVRTNQTRVQTSRGGFRGGGGTPDGSRIRNPKTGQVAIMKGGQWTDEKTGKPIQAGR